MAPNKKSKTFIMVLLFVLASFTTFASGDEPESLARSTGNEEIIISVSEEYYDRDSDFTFTITSKNLDPNTEYTLTWELCTSYYNQCTFSEDGNDPAETEGSVDLGSGNVIQVTTITFSDPGDYSSTLDPNDPNGNTYIEQGINNETYHFEGTLTVQGVFLDENMSDRFVLGGEITDNSYMDQNENILKNMPVPFSGRFYLDWHNYGILDFDINCGLFEGTGTTPVDTFDFTGRSTSSTSIHFSHSGNSTTMTAADLVPTASSGTHHVECSITRLADNTVMHTVVGNDFQVIDADVTGLEEFDFQDLSASFYERTTSTTTTQTSISVDFTDLYPGETYLFTWELCTSYYNQCTFSEDGNDPAETEGSISFIPATASHTETFTFEDPGDYSSTLDPNDPNGNTYIEQGINNETYHLDGELTVQGVLLDENMSDRFVLGGEITDNSYMVQNENILNNMPVPFSGRFYLDWHNYGVLDFDINCGLFEGTGTTPVDTFDFTGRSTSSTSIHFSHSGNSTTMTAADLVPTASSGTHHVECSITRLADNTVMHTIVGNDFEVIDDTSNQDDATMTVSVAMHATEGWGTVTITAIDLDAGQEYTLDWVVTDYSHPSLAPTSMMQNDHIWVAGNDGTYTYELEFHDLADTTDACISVLFTAGDDELQFVDNVCWASASTADADGDGVYDKNDLCENTPASATVQSDGCSDSDGDGVDSTVETECGSDPNDINSVPTDLDNDGTCDLLDTDADGDGALNVDEIAAGTDPMDANSFPSNMLPTCAVYYSLEVDGMPTSFDGDAAIPALSGATAQAGVSSLTPPVITIPNGSYYITAHCIDTDGDDITVTVNDITVGPMAGEVSAGAIIVIGEDVDETVDVTISWTDGTDTLTAIITVNLDGDASPASVPGFGFMLGMMSIMLAGFVALRREQE